MVVGLALVSSGVFIAQAAASSYVGASATHDRGLAVGLYAMFYYAGGSAGGALPSLFWTSRRLAGVRCARRRGSVDDGGDWLSGVDPPGASAAL